ncbi:MAG: hypothetical protein ACM30I_16025 [Gemmatimonas sp.]
MTKVLLLMLLACSVLSITACTVRSPSTDLAPVAGSSDINERFKDEGSGE